ncbi:MAG: hypothetical protein AUG74_10425 [Bacteroidetes bacterium 13_1_20CM_4_60_6]|nr:MAG: hypothetical protein AUG74_10425 [Bacteroidetes bacterium 13_1_20CM_4_60_6]
MPTGAHDLFASRFATEISSPPDRIIVRRDVNLPNDATIPTLNFASEGQALTSSTLTLANLGNDQATVGTTVRTDNGTSHALAALTLGGVNSGSQVAYYSVPNALARSTDLHTLSVVTSGVTGVRTVTQFYKTPINKTITLGAALNIPTVNTLATSPYLRPRAFVTSQSDYDTAVEVDFTQFLNQVSRIVYVVTTRGFAGGTTPAVWEVTVPDFGNASYDASWGLQSGSDVGWVAHGYKGWLGDLLPQTTEPSEGVTRTSATRSSGQ